MLEEEAYYKTGALMESYVFIPQAAEQFGILLLL